MAVFETNTKSSLHLRSNSLPSAQHPFVSQVEARCRRLKESEATSPSSSSSINNKLNGLRDLYECIDKMLQLPNTQQALAGGCNGRLVDELLGGSLRLLDICSTAQDCLVQSKESMGELESVIRRRRDGENGFTIEVGKYMASKKQMKKAIQKALVNLKGFKKELRVASSNKDNGTLSMLSILKEAEVVTMSSLESSLLFITGPKGQPNQGKWSMIPKSMQSNGVECDSQAYETNEFGKVDAALKSLMNHKHSSIENFHSRMENLEMCIQDLEAEVERLSRQLIRTRVSLLNIFNH